MRSIRQNQQGTAAGGPSRLPDWRNLGVLLRLLLAVNLLVLATLPLQESHPGRWPQALLNVGLWVEPLLLLVLAALAGLRDLLWRLPLAAGQGAVLLLVGLLFALENQAWESLGFSEPADQALLRGAWLSLAVTGLLLYDFARRQRALSPAVVEARLQALNARIRPHFLFNALNAVLSLIRREPRRAEQALEELSDLFRALLREPRDQVSLAEEIELAQQYLALEQLRLGDRLRCHWDRDALPAAQAAQLAVPPLLLQPLLENAVYHGIENSPDGGDIHIHLACRQGWLDIEIDNPLPAQPAPSSGFQMALANIRERLALYYDLEARLDIHETPGQFQVHLRLPCRPLP
ncbi:MAG: hypothetical protein RIR00_1677 [Pseudomonadota bacterium]|jgi:two-component system sensor histidine kinase AlgZ